jgi:hypothetical protein
MKKLVFAFLAFNIVFVSCTDNTDSHNEIYQQTQSIEKDNLPVPGGEEEELDNEY